MRGRRRCRLASQRCGARSLLPALAASGRRARRGREHRRELGAVPGRHRLTTRVRSASPRTSTWAWRERRPSCRAARTPTRSRPRAQSRRCALSWRRLPRAASPGRAWSIPTARLSRRAAASRPSPARSSGGRRCAWCRSVKSATSLPPRRAVPTEPVQADWMLGGFLMLRRRDARRARRLRREVPPLRRGHRPRLPRWQAGWSGGTSRRRSCGTSTRP